jgi:hypothetical protein
MRMLHRLRQPQDFQSQAEPVPAPERKPRAPRKQKVREPSPDSEYSDTDSESDGYEELKQIKDHFDEQPCEYVSPAGLKATKTKKEAIQYLESKNCPKTAAIKKGKMESPKAPGPETAPAKKVVRKAKVAEVVPPAPAPVEVAAPAPPKVKRVKKVAESLPAVAAPAPTLAPPATPAEKKKRAPTAYAIAVGKHRKAGKSFAEAAKAAKAEIDAAKAK